MKLKKSGNLIHRCPTAQVTKPYAFVKQKARDSLEEEEEEIHYVLGLQLAKAGCTYGHACSDHCDSWRRAAFCYTLVC